ncbi:MAG: M48 family metalloprotease, partial [Acidimicrobiales bacterium]|nr:M48 family metalloprotease [Acidimicrobiales bacterium]
MAVATVALVVLVLPAALLLRSVVAVLVAVLVALALGAAAVRLVGRGSASVALAATGARPVGADDEPRLHNLVDGLRVAMGVPEPSLWVVEDPSPNVLAVARNADESALVVTRGLLDGLTRVELEAVL